MVLLKAVSEISVAYGRELFRDFVEIAKTLATEIDASKMVVEEELLRMAKAETDKIGARCGRKTLERLYLLTCTVHNAATLQTAIVKSIADCEDAAEN